MPESGSSNPSPTKKGPLTKAVIVNMLREEIGLTGRVAQEIVDDMIAVITETLVKGETISITGLGRFSVRLKNARPGRNPRTGEPHLVPARKKVFFTLSRSIRGAWQSRTPERSEGSENTET